MSLDSYAGLITTLQGWLQKADVAADAPDCMHRIATRLNEPAIQGVAAWLGALAPPQDPSPDKQNNQRMPMACGSQQ